MEKDLKYGTYLLVYGQLLTDRQRDIIELYYDYDLSLAEISENLSISRQAVLDSLKNACASLDNYEKLLHICADRMKISAICDNIEDQAKNGNLQEILTLVNDVKSFL